MGPKVVPKREKSAPKSDMGTSSKPILSLDMAPGATNISKYISFKNQAIIELGSIGAAAAHTMSTGARYEIPVPEEPKIPEDASDLRRKAIEAEYIELVKVCAKQDKQLDLKIYPEAFAFILGALGPSSKDRVISNMGVKEWGVASVKGDFVALVKALDKSHLSDSGTVTESDKQRLIKSFNSLRQRRDESTADYYQRVENLIRGFEPLSLTVPEDWQQASVYIAGLDNDRYSQFKADTENYAKLKIKDYPKKLVEAHQRAIDYVIPRVPPSGVTLTMAAGKSKSSSSGSGKVRSDSQKSATGQETSATVGSRSGGGAGKQSKAESRRCFVCHEVGHLARNCPLKSETDNIVDDAKEHIVVAALSRVTGESDKDWVMAFDHLTDHHVGFDTMSSANIIKDRDLLTEITKVSSTTLIGVGGAVSTSEVGKINWLSGDLVAFYLPTSPANVLSCSYLKDHGYTVSYDPESDSYTAESDGDDISFTRHGGVYACNLKKHFSMPFETVEGNKEVFTRGEVARAERARQVAAGYGYPSDGVLLDMIRNGVLPAEHRINVDDVLRARRIFGPDLVSVRGKTQ